MIDDFLNDTGKIIFIAMCFAIFIDVIMTMIFFNITKGVIANSRIVKAKITKLEPLEKCTKAYVSLQDSLGQVVNTTIMVQTKKYKENDEIEVLSNKDNPSKIRFNTFLSLWIIPLSMFYSVIMMGVILGIFVLINIAKLPF